MSSPKGALYGPRFRMFVVFVPPDFPYAVGASMSGKHGNNGGFNPYRDAHGHWAASSSGAATPTAGTEPRRPTGPAFQQHGDVAVHSVSDAQGSRYEVWRGDTHLESFPATRANWRQAQAQASARAQQAAAEPAVTEPAAGHAAVTTALRQQASAQREGGNPPLPRPSGTPQHRAGSVEVHQTTRAGLAYYEVWDGDTLVTSERASRATAREALVRATHAAQQRQQEQTPTAAAPVAAAPVAAAPARPARPAPAPGQRPGRQVEQDGQVEVREVRKDGGSRYEVWNGDTRLSTHDALDYVGRGGSDGARIAAMGVADQAVQQSTAPRQRQGHVTAQYGDLEVRFVRGFSPRYEMWDGETLVQTYRRNPGEDQPNPDIPLRAAEDLWRQRYLQEPIPSDIPTATDGRTRDDLSRRQFNDRYTVKRDSAPAVARNAVTAQNIFGRPVSVKEIARLSGAPDGATVEVLTIDEGTRPIHRRD